MIGTIVYSNESINQVFNVVHNRKFETKKPQVMEFTDMDKLVKKLISFQYLLYPPDYLLVEFNGYIYDATDPEVIKIIDNWIDIHYMKESIL